MATPAPGGAVASGEAAPAGPPGTEGAPGGTPVTRQNITADGPLRIEIHPRGQCWVRLTVDGKIQFARVMNAGDHEVRTADGRITIEIGNAGVFETRSTTRPGGRWAARARW